MTLHIVLVNPEIPPNTGNIIRLAANIGAHLHLVEPLGFAVDDKQLRRAGLDYRDKAMMTVQPTLAAALAAGKRVFAVSAQGTTRYDHVQFERGDMLLFGRESTGLPQAVVDEVPPARRLFIPMSAAAENNRSFNLSNAVAILAAEVWRQWGFAGAARGADG